jgi:hypothetical protein
MAGDSTVIQPLAPRARPTVSIAASPSPVTIHPARLVPLPATTTATTLRMMKFLRLAMPQRRRGMKFRY